MTHHCHCLSSVRAWRLQHSQHLSNITAPQWQFRLQGLLFLLTYSRSTASTVKNIWLCWCSLGSSSFTHWRLTTTTSRMFSSRHNWQWHLSEWTQLHSCCSYEHIKLWWARLSVTVNHTVVCLILDICFNSRFRISIFVYNQPPSSTQRGHPSVGRRNEYQSKDSDALQPGIKCSYGSCVGGR